MTNKRIWLSPPHMGGNEIKYVNEAFDSNWISPAGPNIDGFERDIATYLGEGVEVAALSSGTAAIHLALKLLNVIQGDEVLCSTFTFAGSSNPILYVGAKPIFIDSESLTWNMDPEMLDTAIQNRLEKTGKKPKAIILVHLYGMPAQLDLIVEISKKYGIPIIEDAAEALGSSYKGQKCGTFGDIGILSFNGNKIITTSGGGAFVSKHKGLVEKAKFLATQARDNAPHYQHSELGYNYRLSNVSAGIGRGQMEVLDDRVKRKRDIFDKYKAALHGAFEFLDEGEGTYGNRWLSTILNKSGQHNLNEVRNRLNNKNIESRPLWKPMHLQPLYMDCLYFGVGISNSLYENGLCLPSGTSMSDKDLECVIKLVLNK